MHNIILISHDRQFYQRCSLKQSQALLRRGLACIVKFYPYTLQFKAPPSQDPAAGLVVSCEPYDNPPQLSHSAQRTKQKVEEYHD